MWSIPCMLEQKDPLSKMNLYLPFGSLIGISNILDPNRSLGSHFFAQTYFFSSLPLLSKCDHCSDQNVGILVLSSSLSFPPLILSTASPLISTPNRHGDSMYFSAFLLLPLWSECPSTLSWTIAVAS